MGPEWLYWLFASVIAGPGAVLTAADHIASPGKVEPQIQSVVSTECVLLSHHCKSGVVCTYSLS